MRTFLYSLRTVNGKSELVIDLGGRIISEDLSTITIKLQAGAVTLNRWDYQNKHVIYDDGEVFFMICNKHAKTTWVKRCLLNYAVAKVEKRIDNLHGLIAKYKREIIAA